MLGRNVLHRPDRHVHSGEPARDRRAVGSADSVSDLELAERYCRDLTRREARNFYWGFIALPKAQRSAIYAVYSFARQVDDSVDLARGQPADAVLEPLRLHRERLERCYANSPGDPVMIALSQVVRRYGIPRGELDALIRGVETDMRVTRYASWDELQGYCRLVASSIGRMCVRIFGFTDPAALTYADDLGIAMQLANALRDVSEDLGMGRIYLPQDDLARFGVSETEIASGVPGPGWEPLMRFEMERARDYFASGLRVTELIPRRAAACVLTMSGIYRAILDQLAIDPALPLQRRASLDGKAKAAVMLTSWLRAV